MRKAIIGLTASFAEQRKLQVTRYYSDWILYTGRALPFIIPYTTNHKILAQYVDQIDGLLLTGGGDIDPAFFGEEPLPGLGPITPERDILEMALAKQCLREHKPILGICRGCQLLNVAAGGSIYQDLTRQYPSPPLLQHDQEAPFDHTSHTISITAKSKLEKILGLSECKTNSFHHQAIKAVAPSFTISAKSGDGLIEAIECKEEHYALGVQWHPECMPFTDPISHSLFHSFALACQASFHMLKPSP